MKIDYDDLYDLIEKVRLALLDNEYTGEEALDLLMEELSEIEYDEYA